MRRSAATGGHFEMLKWARANGLPVGRGDVRGAAEAATSDAEKSGARTAASGMRHVRTRRRAATLEVLQWARENGCPWDVDTCAFAAGGGHLEVLEVGDARTAARGTSTCALAAGAATSRC